MTSAKGLAGALLIAVPLIFTAGFTGLQATFDYPDILRHPAGDVLTRFATAGVELRIFWYAMLAAALGMIPASIAAGLHLWKRDNLLAGLSIGFGALAGLVQALGLIRWVILTPSLAAAYVAPGAAEIDRAMTVSIFNAANLYLGLGVGEHLGYLFTAAWTATVSALLYSNRPRLAISGLVLSLCVLAGMLEPAGVPMAADVNAIGYSLWALWALILGVLLLAEGRAIPLASPQPV